MPICTPAFSIENCGREAEGEGVTTAKTGAPLERLKALHARAAVNAQTVAAGNARTSAFPFVAGLVVGGLLVAAAGRMR